MRELETKRSRDQGRVEMKAILATAGAALLLLACGSQPQTKPALVNEVPPKAESLVQPSYPESARKAGIEGTSIVDVTIGADGAVLACSLVTSSGNSYLDQAALGAAKSTRFAPGTRDGKPVEMKVKVPFKFNLSYKAGEQRGEGLGGPSWAGHHEPVMPVQKV